MRSIIFRCEVVTPLFMGGAEQQAELRTQSFKGLFRYWFRVLGGSVEDEKRLFGWGGDGAVASSFKLVVGQVKEETKKTFVEDFAKEFGTDGKAIQSGFNYLSFSLDPRFNQRDDKTRRQCIPATKTLALQIIFHPFLSQGDIQKIVASIWAAFYLGNFGSRARRGFGSLRVRDVEVRGEAFDSAFKDIKSSFVVDGDVVRWYSEQIQQIKKYFQKPEQNRDIASLHRDFTIYRLNKEAVKNISDWIEAVQEGRNGGYLAKTFDRVRVRDERDLLDTLGFLLMAYRSYYNPDYTTVKNILQDRGQESRSTVHRIGFGLPLGFYFSSIRKSGMIDASLSDGTKLRRASPIIMKIVKTASGAVEGFFIYAKSKFLPDGATVSLKGKNIEWDKKGDKEGTGPFTLVDKFFEGLLEAKIITEVYRA